MREVSVPMGDSSSSSEKAASERSLSGAMMMWLLSSTISMEITSFTSIISSSTFMAADTGTHNTGSRTISYTTGSEGTFMLKHSLLCHEFNVKPRNGQCFFYSEKNVTLLVRMKFCFILILSIVCGGVVTSI